MEAELRFKLLFPGWGSSAEYPLKFIAWGSGLGVTLVVKPQAMKTIVLILKDWSDWLSSVMKKHGSCGVLVAESESRPPGLCFIFICQVPLADSKAEQMNARPFALCHFIITSSDNKPNEIVTVYSYDYCTYIDASIYPGTVNTIK